MPLPNGGSGIDFKDFPFKSEIERLRPHVDNLRSNIDTIQRLQTGQIGPEVGSLLQSIGPRGLQKALKSGQLQLDINPLKPFIGLRYNF